MRAREVPFRAPAKLFRVLRNGREKHPKIKRAVPKIALGGSAGGAAVGKGARVSVGLSCMLRSSTGRADGCATVSESEWMPVGFKHMHGSRGGRAPGCATVVEREWMPVG